MLENYIMGDSTFYDYPFTRSACLNYCTVAYEYNGDRSAASAGLSSETPTQEEAIEWDRVVRPPPRLEEHDKTAAVVALNPSTLLASQSRLATP